MRWWNFSLEACRNCSSSQLVRISGTLVVWEYFEHGTAATLICVARLIILHFLHSTHLLNISTRNCIADTSLMWSMNLIMHDSPVIICITLFVIKCCIISGALVTEICWSWVTFNYREWTVFLILNELSLVLKSKFLNRVLLHLGYCSRKWIVFLSSGNWH
jgi:hypothetical protein